MADANEKEEFIFKGKQLDCKKELLAQGSSVYAGYFNDEKGISFDQGIGGRTMKGKKEAAIRRIRQTDCLDDWKSFVSKFMRSNVKESNVKYFDLNIVMQIFAYEDDKYGWRYFALEPYISTLFDYCNDLYEGPPLPSEPQVIDQMISGIDYLHKEKYSHGDLNPLNITITRERRIKLADFGLSKFSYTRKSDQPDYLSTESGIPEICRRKYWIKWTSGQDSELVNDENDVFPEEKQDIFAVGCLIVYFLIKMHPFGDDVQAIENNMKSNNPINLEKLNEEHSKLYKRALDNMIKQTTANKSKWWREAIEQFGDALLLKVNKNNLLGQGSYGKVYEGKYRGVPVAVKEIEMKNDETSKRLIEREILEHTQLDHENVLKLLTYDDKYTFLVLELCAGTLTDYCAKKYGKYANGRNTEIRKWRPVLPPDGLVLYQIANGLHYIHSRNLVHRDVKPDNILISTTTPVQMKLSDFGFVKKTSPRGTFTQSGLKGTEKWMAPEILELVDNNISEYPRGTFQSDTFAAGCVFFYFLTRGKHPFGKSITIQGNIVNKNPIELNQHVKNLKGDDRALYELIGEMVTKIDERISLPEVIKQLTTKLYASRQFKKFEKSMSGIGPFHRHVNRFHPTEPVLASGVDDKVILLSADNSSIPFSNWKEKETQLQPGNVKMSRGIEWNVDGTQLAAIFSEDVIVWSYPSGEILFQKKLDEPINRIEWNRFSPNVFATYYTNPYMFREVCFFNSCPIDQRPFHFCTIKRKEGITNVQWISANRVALGSLGPGGIEIEIWEIDESTTSAQIVKRFQHGDVGVTDLILDMAWDERTKCLAACSYNGWIQIWSMDSDQPIHATKVDGRCPCLAWRPNGKPTDDDEGVDAADNFILACGMRDGQIVIWTLLAEEKTRIFSQHSRGVDWLSFSPDGRFLASADDDRTVIIWSTENWEPVYSGKGKRWIQRFSWLSSSSTDVPDYKLTFESIGGKVHVVEYAVVQSENPSKDGSETNKVIAKERETRGEHSIGFSGDLK